MNLFLYVITVSRQHEKLPEVGSAGDGGRKSLNDGMIRCILHMNEGLINSPSRPALDRGRSGWSEWGKGLLNGGRDGGEPRETGEDVGLSRRRGDGGARGNCAGTREGNRKELVEGSGDQDRAQRFFFEAGEDTVRFGGFIDVHTHGIGEYDTRTGDHEDILQLVRLHGAAKTEAVLLSIYPGEIREMRRHMGAVRRAMEVQHSMPGLPPEKVGSRILGVHLEGPFLNPKRCGALEKHYFASPSVSALKELIAGYEDIVKVMTIAPEMPRALTVIEKCSDRGIRVNMGHSDATFQDALDGKKAGATGITHIFNAMRPFHHREPGLAGLGLIDQDLYIEVIADGVHVHAGVLELIFSRKRLDRIILVSDSVKGGGKKGMPVYKRKGVLAGSGITLSDSAVFLRDMGIPDAEIIEAAVDNPARYIGYTALSES